MSSRRTRRLTQALAITSAAAIAVTLSPSSALAGGSTAGTAKGQPAKPRTTQIQLLSFNDFHGNLEAPSGSSGLITTGYTETQNPTTGAFQATATTVPAGGVEYLATHLKDARRGHPDSLTVAAGDLIGAS